MNFDYSEKVQKLRAQVESFMDEFVYPNERTYQEQLEASEDRWTVPPIVEDLKKDGLTDRDLDPLFRSAEGYIRMWERSVAATPVP